MSNIKTVNVDSWNAISKKHPEIYESKNFLYLFFEKFQELNCYLGISKNTNDFCLMLRAPKTSTENRDFPDTDGLEYKVDSSILENGQFGLILSLKNEDYQDVFVALVNDILTSLAFAKSPAEVVEIFFVRLGLWQKFMSKGGGKALGRDARKGLFGELHFLEKFALPTKGVDQAIKTWSGPGGGVHDFEFGKSAVEIKASAGKKSQKIMISNERQLDNEGYESLHIVEFSIAVRKNSEPNLVTQIRAIETALGTNRLAIIDFHNKLLQVGYHAIHEPIYCREGYHVEEENCFEVKSGFPRIVGEDLMPGIGNVKYSVDLSACEKFRVLIADLEKNLRK